MKRFKPHHAVLGVVAALFVALFLPSLWGERAGRLRTDESAITKTIGLIETDATAEFQVRTIEGADPEHESSHMFEALNGLAGLGAASLDTQTLILSVTFDSSTIDETVIRSRLVEAGYIAPTREDAAPTELAEDGSSQRVFISDSDTGFEPNMILAKAGVPISLEFGPGLECRVAVKIPSLGLEQNIAQGGTVELPALEPGEYQINCSGDAPEALLIVE